MSRLFAATALAAAAATWTSHAFAEPPLPSGRFRVGSTSIMCVKEPCPRIGVVQMNEGGRPGWPIYSGATPPRVEGAEGAREAVERNWSAFGCLIVEGAFVQPAVLRVDRVVGRCRR